MRVPAIPFHGSIGVDGNHHDETRTGLCSAVIPVAGLVCLGIWILAIWKAVDLIAGA